MASTDGSRPTRVLNADKARLEDVGLKQARVAGLLRELRADALLLQNPRNIAWFTAGGNVGRAACEASAAVFATPDARVIVTNNVDAPQLFERELFGLGFQLKQRGWHEKHTVLIDDLMRGRKVVSDSGYGKTRNVEARLRKLRLLLTPLECDRMRRLGKVATYSVEATARSMFPGQTEAEIAGEVAHRLMKRTVTAEQVRVCADGRSERYRHWTYGSDPVQKYAIVSCVASRWGLSVAVSRTVSLHPVDPQLAEAHRNAMLMHATGMFFSRNGRQLSEVWPRLRRIYEKFDLPHEWYLADQADVIGFGSQEVRLTPENGFRLQAPMAMHWHPSVGPAQMGDSILVNEQDVEFLTISRDWPLMTVEVKGHAVLCPDIYVVPSGPEDALSLAPGESAEPREHGLLFDASDDSSLHMDSVWEMEVSPQREPDSDDASLAEESVLD